MAPLREQNAVFMDVCRRSSASYLAILRYSPATLETANGSDRFAMGCMPPNMVRHTVIGRQFCPG